MALEDAGADRRGSIPDLDASSIAVILPCFNEGPVIGDVVAAFRAALPNAVIYVYDNNSSDNTSAAAREAGATVFHERRQGKGHVIRRAFAQIDADIYLMADGDGTYDAGRARALCELLWFEQLDMVVGARISEEVAAYRPGHVFGNRFFTLLTRTLFGLGFTDVFSGYRVFSRPFVKSFPALAGRFETETEMNIHALALRLPTREVPTAYGARMHGTASKLKTYRDGFRILVFILRLLKQQRPQLLFGTFGIVCILVSLGLGVPVIFDFIETGLVERLPTAVAASSTMVIAVFSLAVAVVLGNVAHIGREQRRLAYLATPRWRDVRR